MPFDETEDGGGHDPHNNSFSMGEEIGVAATASFIAQSLSKPALMQSGIFFDCLLTGYVVGVLEARLHALIPAAVNREEFDEYIEFFRRYMEKRIKEAQDAFDNN